MAQRYTRKDAERCFTRFVKAVGGRAATSNLDHGALLLDYEPSYGGYEIRQIDWETSGQGQPFGSGRMKAEAFCDAVRLTEGAFHFRKVNAWKNQEKDLAGARRRRKARR